ncbi:MAG TPA: hypothetical protein DHV68_09155 [Dehalococcoidia bacterium]|nr:hypothetical protein [Chloroflexota bacterium]HCI86999.1 hypothetical protein [Dehalococcoidia bacterium]|tara:strand:- start:27 stop:410 length:384 start_codon:yes stop_codon:yes gene_type:complete
MPTDRSEPTLPNLICNQAPIEEIQSRIDQVSDIDEADFKGWSGLHWALVRELPEVIKLLLDSGADPNLPTGAGHIPLNIAIRSGQFESTQMLLTAGADFDREDSEGNTPKALAAIWQCRKISKLFSG